MLDGLFDSTLEISAEFHLFHLFLFIDFSPPILFVVKVIIFYSSIDFFILGLIFPTFFVVLNFFCMDAFSGFLHLLFDKIFQFFIFFLVAINFIELHLFQFPLFFFIPDYGFMNFFMEFELVVVLDSFGSILVIFDPEDLEPPFHHFYMFLCVLQLPHCEMIIMVGLNLASSIVGVVGFLLHV